MTGLPRRSTAAALLAVGLLAAPALAHHKDGHDQPPPDQDQGQRQDREPGPGENDGNPGTIKIAAPGEGTHPDNNPKPGCPLRVDFYGFNTGTYSLRINAQPPTGDGQQLAADSVTITQPRNGADGHYQTSRTYDLRSALAGIEPAQQGYHVKVTVTDPDQPGNGGKHKVAWLDCPPAQEAAAVAPRATAARPAASPAPAPSAAAAPARAAAVAATRNTGASAEVLGVRLTRPADQPAPAAATARDTLPFTGSAVGRLLWVATALLVWGAFLTAVPRLHRVMSR